MPNVIWGVDSATAVNQELFSCVVNNFGKPRFWGRYLSTVPNVSGGLTEQEVGLLHGNNVKILPIYNDYNAAVGYREGRVAASNAVYHARRLGIPKDIFLFANTERFFDIDEAWIRGWVDAIFPSGYRPGIYADPTTSSFNESYCAAVRNNAHVRSQVVIWSQEPTPGSTPANQSPAYNPTKPTCEANVWGWQYGENAETCPIDTNLIDTRLFNNLW
ncbi:glycoside hydrolase domain-containing protein [Ornithinibacillus salinisoli]|uniref:Glycoside hydrolase domain-containing protein n=1 Tax=Ornithinibacillus salinisoli TaxID=1848459 RepID=A0ABW4VWH9_9BACI